MGVNVRGKSEKVLKSNVYGFKFRDSNQSTCTWHCCTSDDIIDTSAHDLARYLLCY